MNYRPPHDPNHRPSLLPEKPPTTFAGGVFIALQLFAIFLLVRLVMLETGVKFISIPVVDPLVLEIITFFKRYFTEFGLM
ncbi:hypothetical protein MRY87_09950 [bacterium]|nr:hypothetical protein [bacterium]